MLRYIPVDRSGHYFYQLMDFCTLVLAAHVVYCCHKTYAHTYQEENDTFPIAHVVLPCVVLACFVHGDFNRNLFFDIVWFSSLNLETVTMLPQLWMMSKIGGKVNGVSKSFVIGQIVCKVICVTFWIWAYPELIDRKGSNLAGKHIFGASSCGRFAFRTLDMNVQYTAIFRTLRIVQPGFHSHY